MPDDEAPPIRWWACELPYREIDPKAGWHDDCDLCARRRRMDPTGTGMPVRPSRAAMEAARQRTDDERARPGDADVLRRWRLFEVDAEERRRPRKVTRREGSTLATNLRRAIDDLTAVVRVLEHGGVEQPALDHAVERMRDARPGPGATAYDSAIRSPTATSKEPPGLGTDVGGEALAETTTAAKRVAADASTLRRRVNGWEPHAPTPGVRLRPESASECQLTRAHLDKFEPAYRTGDVGGLLPKPLTLGRFAYDFVLRTGRVPTGDEMLRHDQGLRVYVRAS